MSKAVKGFLFHEKKRKGIFTKLAKFDDAHEYFQHTNLAQYENTASSTSEKWSLKNILSLSVL